MVIVVYLLTENLQMSCSEPVATKLHYSFN
uniref:Uncharacterized protein n=1 Tax=Anguilla anguilla TaxID=7936 RepID=A0A0E9VDE7_ANGAN